MQNAAAEGHRAVPIAAKGERLDASAIVDAAAVGTTAIPAAGKVDWSPGAWADEDARIAALYEEGLRTVEKRRAKREAFESRAAVDDFLQGYKLLRAGYKVLGIWEVACDLGTTRRITLLRDGAVKIGENRAERGAYEVEVGPKGTTITARLFLTPGPSVRATEYVFRGLVDEEFARVGPRESDWSMCKVAELEPRKHA